MRHKIMSVLGKKCDGIFSVTWYGKGLFFATEFRNPA